MNRLAIVVKLVLNIIQLLINVYGIVQAKRENIGVFILYLFHIYFIFKQITQPKCVKIV